MICRSTTIAVGTGLLLAMLFAAAVFADDQDEAVLEKDRIYYELQTIEEEPVTYRRLVKGALENHLAAYVLIHVAKAPHPEHADTHADAILALLEQQSVLYPEGSETESTRPEIWDQPEVFSEMLARAAAAASSFRELHDTGNRHQVMNALTRVGESCEGCHNRFRLEQADP